MNMYRIRISDDLRFSREGSRMFLCPLNWHKMSYSLAKDVTLPE